MQWQIIYKPAGYHFRYVAANGRIVVWSEDYTTHSACVQSLNLIRTTAASAPVVDLTQGAHRRTA
jgi:uncharacterized protein YegP (UPF0339 family)